MKSMDYRLGSNVHILFTKQDGWKISMFIVYVDDMIITKDNKEKIIRLKKHLSYEFDLKDLEILRYFLEVEFARF